MSEEMVVVGQITKTFGSEGELIINLFEEFPHDYHYNEPLFVEIDGLAVPFFCERFEKRGRNKALVVFRDMDSERRASELTGLKLYMDIPEADDDRDADGRIYLEDLTGMDVAVGDKRGVIKEFIDGENPLLRIDMEGKEVLVPAVDEFIVGVDAKNNVVYLELPDGLLELYID